MIINYDGEKVFYNVENPLGQRNTIPKEGGLYLVGNTIFNPLTNERFFAVKVGMSTNLYDRMKNYSTSNPLLFHIAYKVIPCDEAIKMPHYKRTTALQRTIKPIEEWYHQQMEKRNFCRFEYAQEWFIVDEDTYMEICEKKFDYFD